MDTIPQVGVVLREWRAARRLSQLDLSFRAKVSARHISYIETGKALPSRDMVTRLAEALDATSSSGTRSYSRRS